MIPAPFDYQRAASVDEAIELLTAGGDEAKLLAGGHSLLPLMKLRLAQPTVLVDIGRIGDLSYVEDGSGTVRIGAMTRHHDVASSDLVREQVPLLAEVAGQIGDPQVRHRGTVGGSIAHGDPASDLPAALLALRGTLVVRGPGGEREIAGRRVLHRLPRDDAGARRGAHRDPGPGGARARGGRSRSSPAAPRTGRSSASPRC